MSYSIFGNWYTDTVAVYRVTSQSGTGLTTQERTLVGTYNGRVIMSMSPVWMSTDKGTASLSDVVDFAAVSPGDMLFF